ncbi:long-chain acyl-CoA synthetase [Acidocella aminolytica 101 = DSM 11237]|jgi:long-chain acyl-CoA synthetase|nr:acyl-CoA synthetase [Acidocella aminolytica 101 = DSM 11237]SHE36078.1 long-chain acyl-CoA synthetase [Acidocella aminolytica 101 = DSM 11237]
MMDARQKSGSVSTLPVHELLADAVARFPGIMAMDFLGKRTSYAELGRLVERAAAGFQRLGVEKGARVALCLPNTPYYVICYYGILRAGGVVVNLSPLYVENEIRHFLKDSGARIAVTLDVKELYDKFVPIVADGALDHLIVGSMLEILDPVKRVGFWLTRRKILAVVPVDSRYVRFSALVAPGASPRPVPCEAVKDLAVLQYTGGTTGIPKAAMLSHANLTANCAQVVRRLPEITPGGGMLTLVPLFHVFAMTVAMNLSVMLGLEMILLPRYDKTLLRKTLARTKPLFFPGVPTIYANINEAAAKEIWELSSIRYCVSGAAPLPAEIRTRFEQITGCQLVEGYGLSEASPVVACNLFGGVRDGSIGLPVDDTVVEIRALDEPSRIVPQGELGEVCVRGPQVMLGYWNRPDETAKVFVDGALRTGDVGYQDQDGYIFLVDRIKDLIISGGYNVYPRMVEEAFYKHPAVLEVVVIGIPDAKRGQVPKAYVKLHEGMQMTEEALQSFLADYLSPVERPKKIEFRDVLPKTVVGKLSRKELVAEEQAKQDT